MHKIETELLQKSPLQPTFFKRFIDDIFLIWPHTRRRITEVLGNDKQPSQDDKIHRRTLKQRNSLPRYLSIQREWKTTYKGISQKNGPKSNTYIYKSSHPRNQRNSVPYGLLIRARRICSKDKDFKEEATNIITALLREDTQTTSYLQPSIEPGQKTQEQLLKSSKKSEDMRIRLITTYNQRNPPMKQLLLKFADWLDKTKKDIIWKRFTKPCTKKQEI